MRRLSILLPFLPFLSFGWTAECRFVEQDGRALLICYPSSTEEPDGPTMDQQECERLRDEVADVLLEAASSVNDAKEVVESAESVVNTCQNQAANVYVEVENNSAGFSDTNLYHSVLGSLEGIRDNLQIANGTLVQSYASLESMQDELRQAAENASNISCPANQSCSGSGNDVECPCTEQWNQQLSLMSQLLNQANIIATNAGVIAAGTSVIASNVQFIADGFASITNRLNSPDDRMWSELRDIYATLSTNVHGLASTSLNLEQLFYNLRKMIRGDGYEPLPLSTEGVISLNQLALDMASFGVSQVTVDYVLGALNFMTNRMSQYYDMFNLTLNSLRGMPTVSAYDHIYQSMTNSSLSPRTRWLRLSSAAQGSVTNWFRRMELYQQASLGWFDDYAKSLMEDSQERLTESQIEYEMANTTNSLGAIVGAGSNLFLSVANSLSPVAGALASVEITASLPTQIQLWPETDIGVFGTLDAMYFETSDITEYCDVARNATTLVWKVIIWALYISVAAGIARLLFLLVLFVIHFLQNL